MLKQVMQVLLIVALVAGFIASSASAFGRSSQTCTCVVKERVVPGGCRFDPKTLQCVNVGCNGYCY